VPSLDARIAARLGLRPDVRRVPLFGLGCMAVAVDGSDDTDFTHASGSFRP
jgi:alkylresorcinol/alkylpyrone synthase